MVPGASILLRSRTLQPRRQNLPDSQPQDSDHGTYSSSSLRITCPRQHFQMEPSDSIPTCSFSRWPFRRPGMLQGLGTSSCLLRAHQPDLAISCPTGLTPSPSFICFRMLGATFQVTLLPKAEQNGYSLAYILNKMYASPQRGCDPSKCIAILHNSQNDTWTEPWPVWLSWSGIIP